MNVISNDYYNLNNIFNNLNFFLILILFNLIFSNRLVQQTILTFI